LAKLHEEEIYNTTYMRNMDDVMANDHFAGVKQKRGKKKKKAKVQVKADNQH